MSESFSNMELPRYPQEVTLSQGGLINLGNIIPQGNTLAIASASPAVLQMDILCDIRHIENRVVSYDPRLNDPNKLWIYFLNCFRKKPTYHLKIHGYHKSGNGKTRHRTIDFDISLGFKHYIADHWERILVIPSEGKRHRTFSDCLLAFTNCPSSIKEIIVDKRVELFDIRQLKMRIRDAIIATGYHHHLRIQLVQANDCQAAAKSSSLLTRLLDNFWFNMFCILSFTWIFMYPIVFLIRYSCVHNIVAYYPAVYNDEHFFDRNRNFIIQHVQARSKGIYADAGI